MSEENFNELDAEGISCRVEGDTVVCTGLAEVKKTMKKTDFTPDSVRKLFEAEQV